MEKVSLVYCTDLHGYIVSDSWFSGQKSRQGLAHISTRLKSIREEGNEVIFFDNGDLISGSLLSIRCAEDKRLANPVISVLNYLDCRFSVFGNHELDFGKKYFDKIHEQSEFPWLASNICKKGTEQAFFGDSYYIHETEKGTKIAFVGITTPETEELANKDDIKGMRFLEPIEALKGILPEVKEQKPDFITVCYHGGYDSGLGYWMSAEQVGELKSEICEEFPEIDLFVTGHTHGRVAGREINGVHTLQAGCNGLFLGRIDLSFHDSKDLFNHANDFEISSEVINIQNDDVDEEILDLASKSIDSTREWLEEVIADSECSYIPTSTQSLFIQPNRMISLIHDVIRSYAKCDITVAHYWDLSGWAKGEVSRLKLLNLFPENYIHILKLTGRDIRLALERTVEFFTLSEDGRCLLSSKFYDYDLWGGIYYTIDISKPTGERVTRLEFNGEEVDEEERYAVALFHFRSGGALGYDMMCSYRPTWKSKKTIRDYFFDYLKSNESLEIPVEHNFKVVNGSERVTEAFQS